MSLCRTGWISPALIATAAVFWTLVLSPAAQATPLNFTFTITNTVGKTPGTVTGQINGLVDNATSAAKAVYVLAYPTGLDGIPSNTTNIIDAFEVDTNSFTVRDGEITSSTFISRYLNGTGINLLVLDYSGCGIDGCSFLQGSDGSHYVGALGPESVTYTRTTTPVPEPPALLMFLGGLGLIGATLCFRRPTSMRVRA